MKLRITDYGLRITGLLLSLLLTFGCQPKTEKEKATEAIPVKVLKVQLKELSEALEYTGDIKAQDEAIV